MRPLIGITCGTSALDCGASQPQDRLNHAYSRAVILSGGVPVILPTALSREEAEAALARLDGILLSGGADLDPALYGQKPLCASVEVDSLRDAGEMAVVQAALAASRPMLAICRGMQALNVALGGTLIQDIPAQAPSAVAHRQGESRDAATHAVSVEEGTRLRGILGCGECLVNSFHHQAIQRLGEGLRVAARAPDGIIEGVEMSGRPFVLGVQWHPEELAAVREEARRLFAAFVEACAAASLP